MCTIVVLHRVHPSHPLVVAANRDEFYERPATPPQVLAEGPRVVGGLDRRAGGTWMGVTDGGMFAGITNQRTWHPPDATRRSRGELALDVLHAGSAEGARELVRGVDARELNSFNLIFGEPGSLHVAYGRHESADVELHELGDGVHVLTNDRIGSPSFPKAARAEALARAALGGPWEQIRPALERALADHQKPDARAIEDPPPQSRFTKELLRELQALCIHTPSYGTRSATVLAIDPGRVADYRFADGAPCTTRFEDHTATVYG